MSLVIAWNCTVDLMIVTVAFLVFLFNAFIVLSAITGFTISFRTIRVWDYSQVSRLLEYSFLFFFSLSFLSYTLLCYWNYFNYLYIPYLIHFYCAPYIFRLQTVLFLKCYWHLTIHKLLPEKNSYFFSVWNQLQ